MIPFATQRYWRLIDPFCSDAAATGAAKIANAFECPDNPQKCPLPEDRGQTDRFTALPRPYALDISFNFNV